MKDAVSVVPRASERVLVVGGAGFVGRHVLTSLLEHRFSVAALDLFKPDGASPEINWIIGSALDEALFASASSACDIVVFLAASSLPNSANADMAAEVTSHVRMVVKAAEIACSQGVSLFVFASSGGTVYGSVVAEMLSEDCLTRPLNAYGVSKIAIENYLGVLSHLRRMRTVSLRISNPFGPGQRAHRSQGFIAAAMSSAVSGEVLPVWGDGSVVRDFVYVGDVGEAFARCCSYNGISRAINVGSGKGRTLIEVVAAIEKATGRPIVIDYQRHRDFDVKKNVLDVSLAADLLHWRPSTPFMRGLDLTARSWGMENLKVRANRQ